MFTTNGKSDTSSFNLSERLRNDPMIIGRIVTFLTDHSRLISFAKGIYLLVLFLYFSSIFRSHGRLKSKIMHMLSFFFMYIKSGLFACMYVEVCIEKSYKSFIADSLR